MSNDNKKNITESKKSKKLRITLAVLYFIEVVLTTFPFVWGPDSNGKLIELTAFELAVQPDGYNTTQEVKLAVLFAVFILFPLVCFFFCCLDKSLKKNFVSAACCVVCVCMITFGVGASIAFGAVVSLLLYILILFLTTYSILSQLADRNN
ncbi:MAG: hypothetical protein IKB73_04645 [Ruminococcus sp.]|nr:hypothetical protein [Ruminococcus sp.]